MKKNVNATKWDLLVRVSHWLMVFLIAACWYLAENGEMQWHFYSGYALILVVILRITWGFVGSKPARFISFITSPKTVLCYIQTIRSNKHDQSTHSPAGGYSVLTLLTLMLAQTVSGLFSVETDGFDGGPLSELIDYDLSIEITDFHLLNFDILLIAIGLHILAVAFYQRVLKQKILQKMSLFK